MPSDPDGSTSFLDPKARKESQRRDEKEQKKKKKDKKKDKRKGDKKTTRKHKRKSSRSLSSPKEPKNFDNDDASTNTGASSPRRSSRKSSRSLLSSPAPSTTYSESSCSSEREMSTTSVLTDETEITMMASPVAATTVKAVKSILQSQHPASSAPAPVPAPVPAPPSVSPDQFSRATSAVDDKKNGDDDSVGQSSLVPLPESHPADVMEASLTTFQTVSEEYEWVEASVDSHDFFYEEEVIEDDMENGDSPMMMVSPSKQQTSGERELSWVPTPLRERLPRVDVNAAHALVPHFPTTVSLDEEKKTESAIVSLESQHPSPSSALLDEAETYASPAAATAAATVVLPQAPLLSGEDQDIHPVNSGQVELDSIDEKAFTSQQAQLHGINLCDAIASLVSLPPPPESSSDSATEDEDKIIVESPKTELMKKPLQVIRNPSKEYRVNVAQDAAGIGGLTRLREAVVEAVAIEQVEEEEWTRKTVLQAQVTRSAYFQCLNEAAALGQVTGHKPIEYCNWSSSDDEIDEFGGDEPVSRVESLKDQLKESQRPQIQRRTSQLVEGFVRETKAEKTESWSAEKIIDEMGVTLHAQKAWEAEGNDATLPTLTVPKFQKPVCYMTPQRMKDAIARETAEQSLERRYRLEQKRELRMRGKCRCRYCLNPSVFQTQSYARLRSKQNWTDDSMEGEAPEIEPESIPKRSQSLEAVSEHGVLSSPRRRRGFNPRMTLSSKPKKPKSFVAPSELARNEVPSWKKRAAEAQRNLPDSLRSTKSPVKGGLTMSGTWVSPRKGRSVVSSTPIASPRKSLSLQSTLPPAPPDFCDSPILKAKLRQRDWTTVAKKSPKRDEPKPEWASATFRKMLGTGGVAVDSEPEESDEGPPARDSPDRRTLLSLSSFAADEEMDEEELLRQQLTVQATI